MSRGDHVRVQVPGYGGLVWHHGIDVGDGTVVHFHKKEKLKVPIIKRTSMDEFSKGNKIEKVIHLFEDPNPEDVLARASYCLENSSSIPYSLLSNNCEHIASWCRTGELECSQIENAKEGAVNGATWIMQAAEVLALFG